MKTKEAIDLFQSYQKSTHKKTTLQSYLPLILRFGSQYGERLLKTIGPEEVFHFLEGATAGRARSTRRLRYAQLKAFFNFIINRCDFEMRNPLQRLSYLQGLQGSQIRIAEHSAYSADSAMRFRRKPPPCSG